MTQESLFEIYDDAFLNLVDTNAKLHQLCTGMTWTEGPVWMKGSSEKEDALLFSDVKSNTLMRYNPSTGVRVEKAYSNFSNGNYLDRQGNLLSCEHGRRCISRTFPDGNTEILVDFFEGHRLNSPNDVVVRSDNTVWFTDPPYGILSNDEGYKAESQIIGCYVYCYDEKDRTVHIATLDVHRPNGLAFSPDEQYLYVADMSIVEFPETGFRHIMRYEVDGKMLKNKIVFTEVSPGIPDGFRVDYQGILYCSCEDGILVIDSTGKHLGKILVPERVSNCTFGTRRQNVLYITASSSVYSITLKTHGEQYSHLL